VSRSRIPARWALFALSVVVFAGGCRRSGGLAAKFEAGHYFVLAGEVQVKSAPDGTASGKLRFGQEIRGGEEVRGWVRFRHEKEDGYVPRNAVESEQEREVRQKETSDILKLPPQAAVVTRDTVMSWGPSFHAPSLGTLRRGTRVKIYAAEGESYAIELAEPGREQRYVAYAPMSALEWEPSEAPSGGEGPTRSVEVEMVENEPNEKMGGNEGAAPVVPLRGAGAETGIDRTGNHPAEAIAKINPVYPAAARRAKVGGTVRLRLYISSAGSIERVEVVEAARDDLTAAAVTAVQAWKYRPAESNGRTVSETKVVDVRFEPD